MDTAAGYPSRVPASDSALLAALKLRYGRKWRIWFTRDEWHAHRVGNFHQSDDGGAPQYAVEAADLLALAMCLELQDELDAEGRGIPRTVSFPS
jgi:hypothetical protein